MTFDLDITGFDPTNPTPQSVVEVLFAVGTAQGASGTYKVLLLGPSSSAGSQTQDTVSTTFVDSEALAVTLAGAGSPLHRMYRAFTGICKKGVEIWLGNPTRSGGSAATDDYTFSGTITASGVASVYIAGEHVDYAYTISDTATTIATALKNLINAKSHWPVSATNVAGVLTVTAKVAGTEGNTIRGYCKVTSGTGAAVDISTSTALSGGTTEVDYTNMIAALTSSYNLVVAHTSDSASNGGIDDLVADISAKALPLTGKRQQLILGSVLSYSAANTLATGVNYERVQVFQQYQSEEENYMLAAKGAAIRANHESSNPAYNYDNYANNDSTKFETFITPTLASGWPTATQIVSNLNNGVTTIAVSESGKPYIPRFVTTRSQTNSLNDYRVRDIHRVTVADRYATDLQAILALKPWDQLEEDPSNPDIQPESNVCCPYKVKNTVETLIYSYLNKTWLNSSKLDQMLDGIEAGIDPDNPGRINIRTPIYAANLLHQKGTQVAESSPAVLG